MPSRKVGNADDSWKDAIYPGWRESSERNFSNDRGESMFFRHWTSQEGTGKGILVILHGICEHSGSHSPEALAASKEGFFVYAIDHIGHGKSPGTRNDAKSFAYFVDDAMALVKLAKEEHPSLPLVLYGHSLGSCIGVHLLARCEDQSKGQEKKPFSAAIFTGYCQEPGPGSMKPLNTKHCFCMWRNMHGFVMSAAKVLSSIAPLAPAASIKQSDLHDNQAALEMSKQKKDDLHWYKPMRNRLSYLSLKAMKESPSYYDKLTTPMLLLHGSEDSLCLLTGAEKLYRETKLIPETKKKLVVYDGLKHEIIKDSKEALNELLAWLRTCADGNSQDIKVVETD
eukprot:gnl/MRDRNA2_/MRDRNA2_121401_c0_seq1.p1 gnl/MRDRNA2_/MRDRNA2_121401_c0~~gnl/MRDRNA2_/MRDRNA2_121401_c0_seq1.p1  ORF type:complete len:340 (+),score=67.82 gnl/MRDRNA2_/MRDRNA2_121401_c0_seq1:104-1123(+)